MLTIRLQRAGKPHRPEFRIVLAEKQSAASKKFQEILGYYNPRNKVFTAKDESRIKYWIDQNVELSPTVHNLFITKNLLSGSKVQAFKVPKKLVEQTPTESLGAEAEAASPDAPAGTQTSPEVNVGAAEAPSSLEAPSAKIDNDQSPEASAEGSKAEPQETEEESKPE